MKISDIKNLGVTVGEYTRPCVRWTAGNARFHIWLDGENDTFRWKVLFKNPPVGTARGSQDDYRTRHLDPTKALNNVVVSHILKIVARDKLVEKARQETLDAEAEKTNRARLAVVAERRRTISGYLRAVSEVIPGDLSLHYLISKVEHLTQDEVTQIAKRAVELGAETV